MLAQIVNEKSPLHRVVIDVTQDSETGLFGIVRTPERDGIFLRTLHVPYEDLVPLPETSAECIFALCDTLMDTNVELAITGEGVTLYPSNPRRARYYPRTINKDQLNIAIEEATQNQDENQRINRETE